MVFDKIFARNATLLLGSTTTILAAALLAPALPGMEVAFENEPNVDFLVKLSLTMPALFMAIAAPFAGVLLDRWGRKPVIILSLLVYAIAGASGFVSNSLIAILVGRAILGLAVAGITSGFTTLITDYFEGEQLNQFLGYQGAFIGIGGVIFQILAGYLANIGWQYPFLIYLFALVVLPGVILAVDEPVRMSKANHDEGTQATKTLPVPKIAFIYALGFVGMIIFFIFPVHLPFYLTEEVGSDSSQVGFALALQTLSAAVIALLYQRLKARLSYQMVYALIFLTLGINHLFVAITSSYLTIMVGLLIGGIGLGILPPVNSGWVAAITAPEVRGRAIGGLSSALFLGQFLTPVITQPIVGLTSPSSMFGISGGVSLLTALGFFLYSVQQNNDQVTQAQ